MSDVNEIAKQLVADVRKRCDDLLTLADEWTDLEATIAAALASERAKFAAFADENGEPRKVLGDKPSPLVPLAEFVRLAELLDDYAMGGTRVSTTLPDIVAQMNHTANTARLHL